MSKKYHFTPSVKVGDTVEPGSVIGIVKETDLIDHSIMIPPDHLGGKIVEIVSEGDYDLETEMATVEKDGNKVVEKMYHKWPVRHPRPYKKRFDPTVPLLTGQRVIDTFFPIAKGGTGSIPGAFGTGKTVTLHQIAKWADSQVVVYIGCGERGNEMTEVLVEFPHLKDPRTGKPLMDRTILVANTSNMPVAAREASIYTGVTIAQSSLAFIGFNFNKFIKCGVFNSIHYDQWTFLSLPHCCIVFHLSSILNLCSTYVFELLVH